MAARMIDGKAMAEEIRNDLKRKVSAFREKHGFPPRLSVILAGSDPASALYVKMKEKAAAEVGIETRKHAFGSVTEEELLDLIGKLNADRETHGILVQLPLPSGIDAEKVMASISPAKDADGFHASNLGSVMLGSKEWVPAPATPLGIMEMLDREKIRLEGSEAVVVNHSNVVGKPLAMMLLNRNATVTVCHVMTKDLAAHARNADILVTAVGKPGLIKGDMVKAGAAVIDAGISQSGGKVCGDADFDAVAEKASYITPVPGGVGPMTVAMVLKNTYLLASKLMG